jgi:hypothetical protein
LDLSSWSVTVNDLLHQVVEAHGGLRRWRELSVVRASIVTGGTLWGTKGLVQDPAPREMTVSLHTQRSSVCPYGSPDQRTNFSPDRIAIEKLDGTVVAQRLDPRASFAGHRFDTPWDPLHRAYFNGYALWLYLTTPLSLAALPGITAIEIDPVRDGDQMLRGLQVTYPSGFASHSPQEEFYFDEDFLLRRHDYRVEDAGGVPAANYVENLVDIQGIKVGTTRRVYRTDTQNDPVTNEPVVTIDLRDIRYE